jgi:sec-independent protein translocase protein TatC
MSSYPNHPDPDDMFAETRMSFGEHIEDLRAHLIRAIVGFVIAVIASFFFAPTVLAILVAPVQGQLNEYWSRYNRIQEDKLTKEIREGTRQVPPIYTSVALPRQQFRREMQAYLQEVFPGLVKFKEEPAQLDIMPGIEAVLRTLGVEDVVNWGEVARESYIEFPSARIMNPYEVTLAIDRFNKIIRPPMLTTLAVQEGFVVYFKVALMTGFVLGSPWIFYQVWMFVAAGLYPHEKKYVNIFLPFSLGLFLAGVIVCELFVMTKAVEALLWFNEWLGFAPDLRLNEWLGFAIFMPLVFGISFQTPLVMLFIQRVGLLTVDSFRKARRISWFLLAVFAAVITPSVDPISMMLLWIPMGLLYELGIYLCVFLPGQPLLDFGVPDSEEMVEV